MSKDLSGKRILVVEEVVKDSIGHWYEYVLSVVQMCRAEGAEVTAVGHAQIEPEIARELNAIAAFPQSRWDGVYYHPKAWRRYLGVFYHNWLVFRVMSKIVRDHGPVDCLFAPTVTVHHIWGWRMLLARHSRKIKRMVLLFRFNQGHLHPGTTVPVFPRSSIALKLGMRSFIKAIARKQAVFTTDSTRLADEYDRFCGIDLEVFPSPRVAPFPNRVRPVKALGETLVLSSLGPARFEKRINLLQAAIKALLAEGLSRPVKFVIQWNMPIFDSNGEPYERDPELVADPRVEFIDDALDSQAYAAAMDECDIMLLPYERASYYARISGVALEAATAGIPMLYTHNTWNSDLVDSHGAGVGMEDNDLADMISGIRELVDRYEHFHLAAMERRKDAQDAHSSATFLDKLWGK